MLSFLQKTSTAEMSRDEWLAARKAGIGGSDAASILGLSTWKSAFTLWMEKTGRAEDQPDNERLRQGRDLEEYVAQRFCEATGKKVRRVNAMLKNPDYPYSFADVDRAIVGENALLEAKTANSLTLKKYRSGEYPTQYYVQCMHYMAVTGAERVYLAVLVLGQDFLIFTIERDEQEIAALMEAEKSFWETYVKAEVAPPPDGTSATADSISDMYPDSNGEEIDLFGRDAMIDQYFEISAQIKELQKKQDEIKQTLQLDLGESEIGMAERYKVSWKNQTRKTFDAKAFANDHPELDLDEYYKETKSRVFRVNALKSFKPL